ncbi:MAG: hypothetical protein V1782_02710, partial [Pseudomonadota bacterium]
SYFLGTMTPARPSGGLWADAVALGGAWKWLDWFGCFADAENGWVYHSEHGWMFCVGASASDIWFWTADLG